MDQKRRQPKDTPPARPSRPASRPGGKPARPAAKSSLPLILGLAGGALVLFLAIGVGLYFALAGAPIASQAPVVQKNPHPVAKSPPKGADPTPNVPVKTNPEYEARLVAGAFDIPRPEKGLQFRIDDVAAPTPVVLIATVLDPAVMDKKEPSEPGKPAMADADRKPWVRFDHRGDLGVFGVSTTANAPAGAANKSLTFARDGSTNNTIVRVDNAIVPYAGAPGKVTKNERTEDPVPTSEVVWLVGGIEVSERLQVVEGPPVDTKDGSRRFLNTVLVRYRMINKDKRPHTAGMRMQVDTLIGGNDGVPFTVPGYPGLLETFAEFRTAKQIPPFVQALEVPNLRQPGTVAQANLKIGGGIEAPDRVLLTHWTGNNMNWELPLLSPSGDSCIVLYWNDRPLAAGASREVGFEYGLGSVSSSGGKLGVTLGGQFDVGGYFTVSAYVQGPTPKQTLTLTLPPGLERLDGPATQPVPPGKATSVVTWKVQIKQMGQFTLKVASNDGLEQTKVLNIGSVAATKKLALNFEGPYETQKPFKIVAEIAAPAPNQTVTLDLPPSVTLVEGDKTRLVPAPEGKKSAVVEWKAKVAAAGNFPIQIQTSTGDTQRKTLLLEARSQDPGTVVLTITPTDLNTRSFLVNAEVYEPLPDQKVTLELPKGAKLTAGEATLAVKIPATGNTSTVSWPIQIVDDGSHLVKVQATPGMATAKTLVLSGPVPVRDRFSLALDGDWKVGEVGTLTATVTDAAADQTLTLSVPAGLVLMDEPTKSLPKGLLDIFASGSKIAWKVRVERPGSFPVRVVSSTGTSLSAAVEVRKK